VNALTVKDLQEAAKQFLPLDQVVKAVLYPENVKIPDEPKKGF